MYSNIHSSTVNNNQQPERPKHTSTVKEINTFQYIHTMKSYITTWMNLKRKTLTVRSKSHFVNACSRITFLQH